MSFASNRPINLLCLEGILSNILAALEEYGFEGASVNIGKTNTIKTSYQPAKKTRRSKTKTNNAGQDAKETTKMNDDVESEAKSGRKKGGSFFNNCKIMHVKLKSGNNICFMIFSNGNIQVKGCKTAQLAERLVEAIMFGIHGEEIAAGDADVHMINSNMSMNGTFDLLKLCDNLKNYPRAEGVSFNPEGYAGVKAYIQCTDNGLKVTSKIMLGFFKSGKMVITGAKTPAQLLDAYTFVMDYLDECKAAGQSFMIDEVPLSSIKDEPKKRGRKRNADKMEQYNAVNDLIG
jgi:TATA-box binding protein (TBP) (component of TFIID and TFIIIB)